MDVRLAHGAGTGGCAGPLRGLGLGGVGVGGGSHRVVHGVAAHREVRGERFALVHTAASSRKFSTLTASSPWLSSQKRCSRLASTVRREVPLARMSEMGVNSPFSARAARATGDRKG